MIKFNRFNVVNTETKQSARVRYDHDFLADGRECVTLYHKDYSDALFNLFQDAGESEYKNDTDNNQDYFDKGKVRIFTDNPLYKSALARSK